MFASQFLSNEVQDKTDVRNILAETDDSFKIASTVVVLIFGTSFCKKWLLFDCMV